MFEAVEQAAGEGGGGVSPKKLLERLKSTGRLESLKQDLAQRKALDLVAESAKPISIEQAQARDKLWTPGDSERAKSGSTRPDLDAWFLVARPGIAAPPAIARLSPGSQPRS